MASSFQRSQTVRRPPHVAYVLLIGAVVAVLGAVYTVGWLGPAVGLYHDDGIYLITAKSLAEGRGYTIISLPHPIPQTKYPFLFPAALSIVWRIMPDFPRNVPLLKTLPLVCALLWFALTYKLLLRLHATRVQALWIVLLTAASPIVIYFSTNLMSEPQFAVLFMAALLGAHSVEQRKSDDLAWLMGCFAGLAFLTRSAGVALLIGIPISFALRRRFGALVRFLIAGGAVASIWPIWVHYSSARATDLTHQYYSFGNYSSWNILTGYAVPEKIYIFTSNLLMLLVSPGALLEVPGALWLAPLMIVIVPVLLVKRLVRLDAIHISLAAYIGVMLCWAWPLQRFVAIVLPLLLLLLWKAVEALTRKVRTLRLLAIGTVGLISCLTLAGDVRRLPVALISGQFPLGQKPSNEWQELEKLLSWVRTNTPQDAVVLANLDPVIYLYTGRKASRSFVADAYKLFYAPGAPRADAVTSLDEIINATKANFFVMTPDRAFAEVGVLRRELVEYTEHHPGVLERIDRPGADPEYQIYRIKH